MPLMHCNFFSQALDLSVSMDVIVPLKRWKPGSPPVEKRFPTLYLLHGYSDDHTIWQRRTSIERYVEGTNLAVVMPAVHHSFYTDMKVGMKFWTFVSEELPYVARSLFPLSDRREDNFVAGLSMGGYGALKLALTHPQRFAAACSLSGLTDINLMYKDAKPEWLAEIQSIFGAQETARNSENDIFALAKNAVRLKTPLPKFYVWCGTEDFLYKNNVKFKKYAEKLGLDLTYEEGPGDHTWKYWDEKIQTFLGMLPLEKLE